MDVFVLQTVGSILILLFAVLLTKAIFEHFKMKADLEMYIDEYRRVKDEKDKLKVKIDTINRIYKNYEIKILDYTNVIIEELLTRLPRISRKYIVSRIR